MKFYKWNFLKTKNFKLKVKFFEKQKFHFKSVKIELQGKLMNIANSPPQAIFLQSHISIHIKIVFWRVYRLQNPAISRGKFQVKSEFFYKWHFISDIFWRKIFTLKVKFL